jgi:nucleotide-binding universal stress UspA family protein
MYKRILVPVDGSDTADLALDAAIRLAQAFGSRIRLVHVLDEVVWMTGYDVYGGSSAGLYDAMRDWGDELLRKAMERARTGGVEADMMLFDKPGQRLGETVAQAAKLWDADLVVVGTHGRKGFNRLLLGSGAEQVIRMAPVPALVIRASEAASAS